MRRLATIGALFLMGALLYHPPASAAGWCDDQTVTIAVARINPDLMQIRVTVTPDSNYLTSFLFDDLRYATYVLKDIGPRHTLHEIGRRFDAPKDRPLYVAFTVTDACGFHSFQVTGLDPALVPTPTPVPTSTPAPTRTPFPTPGRHNDGGDVRPAASGVFVEATPRPGRSP